MEFIVFDYLTNLEKKKVQWVFQGWKPIYLKSLLFKKVEDGWLCRDPSLMATTYMHIGTNGGKNKDEREPKTPSINKRSS